MKTLYAKPDQTYQEHLTHVLKAWRQTAKAKHHLVKRIAEKYDFPEQRFWKGSLSCVVLHDIGKMTENFQEMMEAIRSGKKPDWKKNYRHELASLMFVVLTWKVFNSEFSLSSVPIEPIAVAGHHKPLNMTLESFAKECFMPVPTFVKTGIEQALDIAKENFKQEGWVFPDFPDKIEKQNPRKVLGKLIGENSIFNKLLQKDSLEKVRTLYFLFKGILHYADWHGSGMADVNYSVQKSPDLLIDELKNRCKDKKIEFKGLRPFQKQMGEFSGNLIGIAPTGSGKTEGSLLWALKNSQEMGRTKILYLLPTMVTANKIWERLTEFFGKENVGLTHSNANLFLENQMKDGEEEDWENRRDVLFDKTFIRPVTVATVDQLLTSGFNAGKWVLKEINAANSVIILDEIHAYDSWTLGLIISSIRHFTSLGARFLLMSATMPTGLQNLFQKELKDAEIIKDVTLLNAKRSTYYIENCYIQEALDRIGSAVKNGKRVLVVVNTVGLCQELAKSFPDLSPICYHSCFTLRDREEIEKQIESANFVIATQVVEVSLDIDFDWLFTECAPPDAIAQRGGRINRYRNQSRDSRVYIFRASEKSEKIYNPINSPDILKSSYEAFNNAPEKISEQDLIDIVDQVYRDIKIEKTKHYQEAITQYKNSQELRKGIFDSRMGEDKQDVTRQSDYEKVSVIPFCYIEDVLKMKPKERQWYEVKIPLWYAVNHKKMEKGIWFCDMEYDKELGGLLKPEKCSTLIHPNF